MLDAVALLVRNRTHAQENGEAVHHMYCGMPKGIHCTKFNKENFLSLQLLSYACLKASGVSARRSYAKQKMKFYNNLWEAFLVALR